MKRVDFHTLLEQLYAVKLANVTLVKGERHTSKSQSYNVMFWDDLSLSDFT